MIKKAITSLAAVVFAVSLIGCAAENAGDEVEIDPNDDGSSLGEPEDGGADAGEGEGEESE
tara:strand:- start:226 stop:408 length:183 start_codon:yes stop_codon:yes gene_type:complete